MPLPAPVARRHIHSRKVHCEGYFREDGLWEVEASLLDTTPFAHEDFERGQRRPEDPVHKMAIRITVDRNLVVVDAHGSMDDVPYVTCHDVPPRMSALIGVKLGTGWRRALREKLPRLEACTHMVELIGPAITTLFQSMSYREPPDGGEAHAAKKNPTRPYFIDDCWSWRADGPNVAKLFPMFAKSDGKA
jgi:hypothetical protein